MDQVNPIYISLFWNIVVQLIALSGSWKLINWRLTQIEKKIDIHDHFDRRLTLIEMRMLADEDPSLSQTENNRSGRKVKSL